MARKVYRAVGLNGRWITKCDSSNPSTTWKNLKDLRQKIFPNEPRLTTKEMKAKGWSVKEVILEDPPVECPPKPKTLGERIADWIARTF